MPENPLLPNRKLQQLYSAMLRARGIASGRTVGMEAIFATLAEQLEEGDAIVSLASAKHWASVLRPSKSGAKVPAVHSIPAGPLAFAAGVAAGAQLASMSRLVTALLDTRQSESGLAKFLDYVQQGRLPLILIFLVTADGRASAPESSSVTWTELNSVAHKLRFPVLTVDGGDAVAVYRAMQESVLRARHGDGPALLWCLLPASSRSAAGGPATRRPLDRMERYLAARSIALPSVATRSRR